MNWVLRDVLKDWGDRKAILELRGFAQIWNTGKVGMLEYCQNVGRLFVNK